MDRGEYSCGYYGMESAMWLFVMLRTVFRMFWMGYDTGGEGTKDRRDVRNFL